jgi:hypothetical protein
MLFSIVYVSTATHPFSEAELLDLLRQSRARNAARGVTGMLLHKEGNFMQVIEGPEDQVRELFALISADPRHHGIIVLYEERISKRQFSDWSMSFVNLDKETVRDVPGFDDFLTRARQGEAPPTNCRVFLDMFRRHLR